MDKEIARRLGYEYKYLDSTTIKSNISVSDLKKAGYEPSDEYRGESLFREKPVLKPRFLQEKKDYLLQKEVLQCILLCKKLIMIE